MFVIAVPYLTLDQVFRSGQAIRWRKIRKGKYLIQDGHRIVKAEQKGDNLMLSCSQKEFFEHWYQYFSVGEDYSKLHDIAQDVSGLVSRYVRLSTGIRVLQQDCFETMIAASYVAELGWRRAIAECEALSMSCGEQHKQSMEETGIVTWYEFPTCSQILSYRPASQWDADPRTDVQLAICEAIESGALSISKLQDAPLESVREALIRIPGMSDYMADYICLYGFHHQDVLPHNASFDRLIHKWYGTSYETFYEWHIGELEGNRGLVRQYLLHGRAEQQKRRMQWG